MYHINPTVVLHRVNLYSLCTIPLFLGSNALLQHSGLVAMLIMSLMVMLIVQAYINKYVRNLVVDSQIQTACFVDELINIRDNI